jgi:medium-chain acyl-[acyl-carrier-protein] hydrolase
MPHDLYVQSFTVRTYEVDAAGLLAPHTLCDFLQEVAGTHAATYGLSVEDLLARNLTWVLSRLRVRVSRLPASGERIEIRTWPSGSDRLFALRDFQVMDSEGREIAAAVSAWLILDVAARKPVRPQTVVTLPDATKVARAFAADMERLPGLDGQAPAPGKSQPTGEAPAPGEAHPAARFPVRFSDIDLNRHVNNASYVQWVAESVGAEVLQAFRLSALDIDFLSETVYGDVVIARALRGGDSSPGFLHSLAREGDGKEIARARTGWVAQ